MIAAFLLDERRTSGSVFGAESTAGRAAILLVIGVYLTTWSIRHCCEDPLRGGLFSTAGHAHEERNQRADAIDVSADGRQLTARREV